MNIVFCSDRRVLAGLHVAAKSVLTHLDSHAGHPVFWVYSGEIDDADISLLDKTLVSTGRPFTLRKRDVDVKPLQAFPRLTGSLAAYYRLLVPDQIDADRYLYLDVDTLCCADLSSLFQHLLDDHPLALCSESPMATSADISVIKMLGSQTTGDYYNSGVMLVDRNRWLEKDVTARCLDFLSRYRADYWDQSAINFVMHGDIATLPAQFNCYSNVRANWPALKPPMSGNGRLIHFVDYPKPWSRYGRWVHPLGGDWWSAYRETAHYEVGPRPDLEMPLKAEQWQGYKKAIMIEFYFQPIN